MMITNEKKKIEEVLNERYDIFVMFDERNEDWLYYAGMLNLIERLGLHWERKEDGKHIVY